MLATFSEALKIARTVHDKLTEKQQEQAAWYATAEQIARRTQLACNDTSQFNDNLDEPFYDYRKYYDEFETLQNRSRSLLERTNAVSIEDDAYQELRQLDEEMKKKEESTKIEEENDNEKFH